MKCDVVLISGKMGSGKTTLSNNLVDRIERLSQEYLGLRWGVEEVTFAGPIYEMHDYCRRVMENYGFPSKHKIKDGNLLQLLGTEWARKTVDENIWVKIARNRILDLKDHYEKLKYGRLTIIVSDLRFRNEFDFFPDGLKIRLEAPEDIRKARVSMWRDNTNHPSEIDLDEYVQAGKFDLLIDAGTKSEIEALDIAFSKIWADSEPHQAPSVEV